MPSDEVGDKDGSLPKKNPQGNKQKFLEWVQPAYQQKGRSFDKWLVEVLDVEKVKNSAKEMANSQVMAIPTI